MTSSVTTAPAQTERLAPYGLDCEHLIEPLGIDEAHPRLAWKLASSQRGDQQTAYRVVVGMAPDHLNASRRVVWDTGWRYDKNTVAVIYDGAPLQSFTRYDWAVYVRDMDGNETSSTSWFETAMLHGEWIACWIAHDPDTEPPLDPPQDHDRTEQTRLLRPAVHLRRAFELEARPVRSTAYVSARGVYELRVNGERVGDAELPPGWTDYHRRIHYQTYDVSDLVLKGENVVGAVLGDGWWCGYIGFDSRRHAQHYGDAPAFIAQLVFDLPDGSRRIVGTDGSWRETDGAVCYSDLLMGEYVDARLELDGWDLPGYDDSVWAPVRVTATDTGVLHAASDQPVRIIDELPAVSVEPRDDGSTIVDLGQNMVGRVRLTVRGASAGQRIRLRFGEMLTSDGSLYVDNLRTAEATDIYIARGHEIEVFEPRFTFHGFRYVEVTGYPGILDSGDIVGRVLSNNTPEIGAFRCSDDLTNKLMSNIVWSQRGNFLGVPTDCPQRDERLGWMADAQIFLPSAMRFADVSAFMMRWLRDIVDSQHADGAFPDVVPEVCMTGPGAPAWGDAGVIIPWLVYREYGDRRILERSFDSMRKWVDYVHRHNPHLVWRNRTGRHYGDWLQVEVETSRDVLATAYFARSAGLVAQAAETLGHADLARAYAELHNRIREAFVHAFVDEDGTVESDTQTAYLLALAFDLLPTERRASAARHLVKHIESRGNLLTTGFVGVALLCPTLCAIGRPDLAYELLHQEDYPSWNYSILHGATTIWERWDGWTPERGFQSAAMNSFNHYSLGSIGDWLYGYVGGIRQADDSVAWHKVVIQPIPGGRLKWAEARQETPRGLITTAWRCLEDTFNLDVTLPPGCEAVVRVPTTDAHSVRHDGEPVPGPRVSAPHYVEVSIGSGHHNFIADLCHTPNH